MKKLLFVFGFGLFFSTVSATTEGIQNLKVTPSGESLLIQWDHLDADILSKTQGYAVNWSESELDLRLSADPNEKDIPRVFVDAGQNYYSIQNAKLAEIVPDDTTYFFRVFTYEKDENGRKYLLGNGSMTLKWKWGKDGSVEESLIPANDPVVAETSSSDDVAFTQTVGNIASLVFDTCVQLSWSRPNLTSSDFEGFQIVISKNLDLSSPLKEARVGSGIQKIFMEGLEPNTRYYVAGYFYKTVAGAPKTFGKSNTINFTTETKFTDLQMQKFERTKKRLQANSGLGFVVKVGETSSSATTSTTSTTTTSSSTNSSTTSTSSSKSIISSSLNTDTMSFFKDYKEMTVKEINAEILSMSKRLNQLKNQRRKLE